MLRFLKNLAKHPGTWTFLALLSVGIAIAVPPAAPALIVAAAVCTGFTALSSIHFFVTNKHIGPYAPRDNQGKFTNEPLDRLRNFLSKHPIQAFIAFLAFGLFVAALVTTIGFFTGGAAFAFMAPVFAAIAAPFATAAAAAGIQLAVSALAAVTLVFASINAPNTVKRFLQWLDSFKYDAVAAKDNKADNPKTLVTWYNARDGLVNDATDQQKLGLNYYKTVLRGIKATVLNGLSSPDAEKLTPPPPAPEVAHH